MAGASTAPFHRPATADCIKPDGKLARDAGIKKQYYFKMKLLMLVDINNKYCEPIHMDGFVP